jgi:hypothetical protein
MFAITLPAGPAGAAAAAAGEGVEVAGVLLWEVVVVPGLRLAAELVLFEADGVNATVLLEVPAMNDLPAPPPAPQPTTEVIANTAAPNFRTTLGLRFTEHLGNRELQLTESKVGRHLLCLYRGAGLGCRGKSLRCW